MQQPSAPPAPVPPRDSAAAPRRTGLLVAALATGLVLGAACVGAAWALAGDDDAPATGPAADAHGACDALAGFDESKYTAKGNEGMVALNRFSGAVTLSAAAAAGDPEYKPLADALSRAQQRHARVFAFDAEVKRDLGEGRRICGGL